MKKKILIIPILIFIIVIAVSLKNNSDLEELKSKESEVQFYVSDDVDAFGNKIEGTQGTQEIITIPVSSSQNQEDSYMYVYFIDVGQADCTLIRTDSENILIDGGNNGDGEDIVTYLKYLGVDHIDSMVATHMHEDHIGGLDIIMDNIETDKVYLPNTREADLPDTRTYEDFLEAIEDNDVITIEAKQGDYIYENGNTSLRILSPDNPPEGDLNDYSIVVKAENGDNSFLFMGDASSEINEMIEEVYPKTYLDIDVLKAGHHGSSTSTDKAWLRTIRPDYCVISCGLNNDYGHPHREVVWALSNASIFTYKTYESGTILATSDGTSITFETGLTGNIPLGDEGWVLP